MKRSKTILSAIITAAVIASFSIPVFAASPINGWVTEGTKSGYPYIEWHEYGRNLGGTVGAKSSSTGQIVDSTTGSAHSDLYVRTPYGKTYSETIYTGYYFTYYRN
ncbi:hypothetical protein ACQPUZ_18435 [Clostridium tertium]